MLTHIKNQKAALFLDNQSEGIVRYNIHNVFYNSTGQTRTQTSGRVPQPRVNVLYLIDVTSRRWQRACDAN